MGHRSRSPSPESIVVNRPYSIVDQYRSYLYATAAVMVFLLALVALQHFHIQRRKRMEEALRRSETRYRDLFDNARDLICSFDPEGRLTAVNRAFQEVLGYEPGDLLGMRFSSIVPDEYREQIQEKVRLKLEGRTDITRHEIEIVAKDGHRVPIEVVSRAIREDGVIAGIQAIGRDVTDRWRAEEAIRKSEERFRRMVEDSAIPIAIGTYDGRSVYLNHKFTEIFGYTIEDIPDIGHWWSLAYPDEDYRREVQAVWTDAIREADRTGREALPQEWRVTCKDGSVRDVEFKYTPMADQRVVVFHDVTERRRAERALHENERMLATLMRNLPGMAYRCKNDPDWTMLFVSEGSLALFGYPPEDLLDGYKVSFANLTHPEDRQRVWDTVQQAIADLAPYQMEYRVVTKSGDVKWVWEQGCAVYAPDGAVLALEGFIADVSARYRAEEESHKLEAQVLQAQKLESLGVLAGGIAHDFNNLLMAILGNADLALSELSPVSPACDSIREIEAASRRAAELCRQMLAYSGKGRFIVKAVNLNDLVQEMAHLLRISISKKVVLKFNFDPDLPAIQADATQMRQVVMNLLTNSSEAIGDRSGVIAISSGHRYCVPTDLTSAYLQETLPEGNYAFLEVADTGSGMGKDTLNRLFDPFFTTKFQGRGWVMAAVLGMSGALRSDSSPKRAGQRHCVYDLVSSRGGRGERGEGFFGVPAGVAGAGNGLDRG
jgi:PAS domain S-box-containing protein